jgi:group I intron endonuclease
MIIYKIVNLINKKVYIGQSKYENEKYFGSGKLIKKAIKKYGIHNFKKVILYKCKTLKELDKLEKYFIDKLNSKIPYGYNITNGGNRAFHNKNTSKTISQRLIGRKLSKPHKLKIGLSTKNKTYEERYGNEKAQKLKLIRKQQLIKHNPMKNGHTKESKLKISLALKGHKSYPKQIFVVKKLFKGKKKSIIHRKKLSFKKMKISLNLLKKIRCDFKNTMNYIEISKKYNISYLQVWKYCNYKFRFEK